MILEPAQDTGSAIDVLRLFLGPGSVGIVGQPSAADGLAGFEPVLTDCRSVLVLAGSDAHTSADRLPALLAECRRCAGENGRIAVLARNRAPAMLDTLRGLASGRQDRAGTTGDRRGFVPALLRAWVRRAGFADAMLFAVAPSADEPEALRPFTLADHLAAPAFVVAAGASEAPGGLLLDHAVQAMEGARSRLGRVAPADVTRLINSSRGKSLAIVERNGFGAVVRVARVPVMHEDESVSYRLIERLQHNAAIRDVVPRPLGEAVCGDFAFFAQSRLPGTPLSRWISDANRGVYVREVERFLRGLNPDLPGRAPLPFDSVEVAATMRPMIEFALGQVADAGLRADAAAGLAESLRGARGRLGIVHGDFGTANILVDRQRMTGVIDWEAARPWGLPILDAFNYLDTAHQSCRRNISTVDNISLLAGASWPVADEAEFLRSMFEFSGIDIRFRRGLALLYALFHFGPQLRFTSVDGPRKRLERVLRWFVRP